MRQLPEIDHSLYELAVLDYEACEGSFFAEAEGVPSPNGPWEAAGPTMPCSWYKNRMARRSR